MCFTVQRKLLILPVVELRPLGRPARSQSLYRLRYWAILPKFGDNKDHRMSTYAPVFFLNLEPTSVKFIRAKNVPNNSRKIKRVFLCLMCFPRKS
jgi:hypothetical protein